MFFPISPLYTLDPIYTNGQHIDTSSAYRIY